MNKKDKKKFEDSGVSFTNMNVPGMPWYDKKAKRGAHEEINLTRKERRAIIWGALLRTLPALLVIAFSFTLAFLLMYLWLS